MIRTPVAWVHVRLDKLLDAASGRVVDAVSLLTQTVEQITAMDMVSFQVLCRLPLGEAQMLSGRLEEAQALAERARTLARAHQERGNEAYALGLLGDIAARREPPESAILDHMLGRRTEARRLLDPALHVMMDAVHRYEGTVHQVLGDGMMALFGAPVAHEDHSLTRYDASCTV